MLLRSPLIYISMVAFNEPKIVTALMELFEPETIRVMVEFPEPIIEPPGKVFPLPLSCIVI